MDRNTQFEEVKLKGNQLVDRVKELIDEGKTRRVIVKKEDRVLMEFPLTMGIGGAAAAVFFAPVLTALGALAIHFTDVTVVIEREVSPILPASELDNEE
ncbi:MAG: DUF4342 domain-containing protein [Rhodothermales bacterium]